MLSPPCASQRFLLSRLHFFSHFARTPERASSHAGQNIRILCHDGYCTRTKGNTQSEALRSAHCTRGGIKPSTAPRRPAGAQVRRRDPLRRSLRRGLPLRTLWARCTLAALLLLWTRGGAATAVPAARRGWAHLRCPLGRPGRHGQDARRALQRLRRPRPPPHRRPACRRCGRPRRPTTEGSVPCDGRSWSWMRTCPPSCPIAEQPAPPWPPPRHRLGASAAFRRSCPPPLPAPGHGVPPCTAFQIWAAPTGVWATGLPCRLVGRAWPWPSDVLFVHCHCAGLVKARET